MNRFQVREDTVIADYVRHRTTLHDGTVVHRLSKELFAFLETLVLFLLQGQRLGASDVMDTNYTDTFRENWNFSYDALHFLIDELTDWYQRFPPAKSVDSDEEPAGSAKVGGVVDDNLMLSMPKL